MVGGRVAEPQGERPAETKWRPRTREILAHRAKELVSGGQLVLAIGAADEDGASGLEPMRNLANGVLKALVAEGKISADTHAAMTIPSRTAPFRNRSLPDLALEEPVIAETPNAAMLRWQRTGDDAAFAADIAGFFRLEGRLPVGQHAT